MAKKSLGHIELQWTCPNCGTINPGPVKVCEGCGAPQPEDVEFHQAERQELVTDEEKLAQAKAGADIHCAYCGTRNSPGAKVCSQCKADLSEGAQRKAGRVVGAFKTGPAQQVACPHCGAENPDTAKKCSQCGGSLARIREERTREEPRQAAKPKPKRGSFAAIGVVLVIVFVVVAFLFLRTSEVSGVVQSVGWERAISIEEFGPNEHEDWYDQLSMVDIEVPPLRQRKEEIPLLCAHFLKSLYGQNGNTINPIPDNQLRSFETRQWNVGNVKELEDAVKRYILGQ